MMIPYHSRLSHVTDWSWGGLRHISKKWMAGWGITHSDQTRDKPERGVHLYHIHADCRLQTDMHLPHHSHSRLTTYLTVIYWDGGFPFTAALIDGPNYHPRRYKWIFVFIFVSLTLILSIYQATNHTVFEIILNLITPQSHTQKK